VAEHPKRKTEKKASTGKFSRIGKVEESCRFVREKDNMEKDRGPPSISFVKRTLPFQTITLVKTECGEEKACIGYDKGVEGRESV